ncbi:MAG: aspartyl protease family protein [Candidatus Endobugula sp.]|jgi:aspartyl protease family protein
MINRITIMSAAMFFLFLCSGAANAAEIIILKGLFGKKSALVTIDGNDHVLTVGKKKKGVLLIGIEGQEAIIQINQQRQRISLSKQVSIGYKQPTIKTVRIASQEGGHYWVAAQINGRTVNVVIDTGATTISMGVSTAKDLGVDYSNGKPVQMSTANGVTEGRMVVLKKVTIGAISRYNISAVVALNDALPVILLGNSFLSGVDMRTENGVLILEQR